MKRFIIEFVVIFLLIFGFIFFISNFQTLYSLVFYHFQKSAPKYLSGTLFDFDKEIKAVKNNNKIIIPKIFVAAPIIFSENVNEKVILANLKNGVVHFPQSKKPGEEGASILLGHSSRPIFNPGKYDGIFLFLPRLEVDDKVFTYLNGKKSVYKVKSSRIVADLSSLDFNKKQPTLYLVTCWPLGTNLKRLVVEALFFQHRSQ